ncbi:MAG: hypothetical protein ACLSB9_33820 [Hydrogeniiclostridium mannosilyticum]
MYITQPAVSQHIKARKQYGTALVAYQGKTGATQAGRMLCQAARTMR